MKTVFAILSVLLVSTSAHGFSIQSYGAVANCKVASGQFIDLGSSLYASSSAGGVVYCQLIRKGTGAGLTGVEVQIYRRNDASTSVCWVTSASKYARDTTSVYGATSPGRGTRVVSMSLIPTPAEGMNTLGCYLQLGDRIYGYRYAQP